MKIVLYDTTTTMLYVIRNSFLLPGPTFTPSLDCHRHGGAIENFKFKAIYFLRTALLSPFILLAVVFLCRKYI